ncbi:MAG: carbohydrate ABC transporter permease [Thermomicrobiales bacterium]
MASAQAEATLVGPSARPEETASAVPRLSRRRQVEAVLFILPAVLFQLSWGWYPLMAAFLLSFTNARVRSPIEFTGLDSYLRMWHDPLAVQAFRVTATYAALTIVLTFVVPIIVAILLMEMPRHVMRVMMLLWFIPLSFLASSLVFRYMYNTQYGIFQWITTDILHLPPQPFLNSSAQVNFWIVFPGLLFFGPGLIYMATLQGIPRSYYEAAEIEGAGFWRKIWTISIPRLRPVISMLLIFSLISSAQSFELQQIMTGGGPGGASRTVVLYLYTLLQQLRYADATALGVFLFLVVMALVSIYRLVLSDDPDAPPRRRWSLSRWSGSTSRQSHAQSVPAPETDGAPEGERPEPTRV